MAGETPWKELELESAIQIAERVTKANEANYCGIARKDRNRRTNGSCNGVEEHFIYCSKHTEVEYGKSRGKSPQDHISVIWNPQTVMSTGRK